MDSSANEESAVSSSSRAKYFKVAIFLVGIGALVVLSRTYDLPGMLESAINWIEGLGALGAVLFVLLYILATVFFLPGSVLTLGAGGVYGLALGFVLVSIGSTLGAAAACVVGRYIARDWVAKKTEGNPKFKALDEAVAAQGWKIVFLTRLTPVFPFNVLNYTYGLTQIPLAHYVLASWIGMMPGTFLYVYIGSIAKTAAEGGTTAGEWAMRIIAGIATLAVTVLITRMASRAFAQAVPASDSE